MPTTPISCKGLARPTSTTSGLGLLPSTLLRIHAWSGDCFLHHLLSWLVLPSGLHASFSIMQPGYIFPQAFSCFDYSSIYFTVQMPNLLHYSSYPECWLIPTTNINIYYVLKPIKHELFYKKYAGKKYFKVCQFFISTELLIKHLLFSCLLGFANGPLSSGLRTLRLHWLRNCQK